jgi:hypothetical protein
VLSVFGWLFERCQVREVCTMRSHSGVKRFLGFLMTVDGLLTAIFGRDFVKFVRMGPEDGPYWRFASAFLKIPPWMLRLGGLIEARIGYKMWKGD